MQDEATVLRRDNPTTALTAIRPAHWTGRGSVAQFTLPSSETLVQKPFRQWEVAVRARFNVEIASVACVVPRFNVSQEMIAEGARSFFPHLEGSSGLFANTGIETRFVCEPPEWYLVSRGWEERTASFQRHALDLLEEATRRAADAAGIRIEEIAAIVTNTVTGLAVPSLEARLLDRLPSRARSSACRSSAWAAAAGSAGWRARCASPRPCPAPTCSSSPSTCAACAPAATIRASPISCPSRCSATEPARCSCATRAAARAAAAARAHRHHRRALLARHPRDHGLGREGERLRRGPEPRAALAPAPRAAPGDGGLPGAGGARGRATSPAFCCIPAAGACWTRPRRCSA